MVQDRIIIITEEYNMKKNYQNIEIEVIRFDEEDVIITSGIPLPDETFNS